MSSGRKEKSTKDLIMMKPGLRAQIPASPSLSLASASSRRALHYTNGGYDSPDSPGSGHDYEELGQYQNVTSPRKSANVIYESAPSPLTTPGHLGTHRHRQMTECSDDSTSTGSLETYHHSGHSKGSHSHRRDYVLGFIVLVSLTSLVLVLLMVFNVVGPKCSQCSQTTKAGGSKQFSMTKIQQSSAKGVDLYAKIETLEKNISSLLIRDTFMLALLRNHEKQIEELKKEMAAMKTRIDTESHLDQFKNVVSEVDALKINVQYLSLNDSLINTKVSGLLQSDSKTKADIATLKNKDVDLESNLKSLRARDAAFNASVNGLKSVDVEMKTAMRAMNASVDNKINNITQMVNELKKSSALQGPPGPQGPQGPQGQTGLQGPAGPKGQDANFAGCTHGYNEKKATSGLTQKSDVFFTLTATNEVVLGATCSTKGGDETNLSIGINRSGQTVYACECLGKSTSVFSSAATICRIDYWLCPKS